MLTGPRWAELPGTRQPEQSDALRGKGFLLQKVFPSSWLSSLPIGAPFQHSSKPNPLCVLMRGEHTAKTSSRTNPTFLSPWASG